MIESPDDQAQDERAEEDPPTDEKPAEEGGDPQVGGGETPVAGGYKDRDPKTEMPIVPSRPDADEGGPRPSD